MTAVFSGGSGPATGSAGLRSLGRPVVSRTATGFQVTLRFRTSERGRARMQALRAGQDSDGARIHRRSRGRDGRSVPGREAGLLHVRPSAREPHPSLEGLSRTLRRAGGVQPVHAHPRAAQGRRRGHALVGHPALPVVAAGRRRRAGRPRQAAHPGGALPDPGRSDDSRDAPALPGELPDQARGDGCVWTSSDPDLVRLAARRRLADARNRV